MSKEVELIKELPSGDLRRALSQQALTTAGLVAALDRPVETKADLQRCNLAFIIFGLLGVLLMLAGVLFSLQLETESGDWGLKSKATFQEGAIFVGAFTCLALGLFSYSIGLRYGFKAFRAGAKVLDGMITGRDRIGRRT